LEKPIGMPTYDSPPSSTMSGAKPY
jgi:hypothetical protein